MQRIECCRKVALTTLHISTFYFNSVCTQFLTLMYKEDHAIEMTDF